MRPRSISVFPLSLFTFTFAIQPRLTTATEEHHMHRLERDHGVELK